MSPTIRPNGRSSRSAGQKKARRVRSSEDPTLLSLKLALVSPYDFAYPGGVTEHVTHLAQQFAAHGHEVHIVAPSSDDESEPALAVDAQIHRIGRVVSIPANGSV